MRRENIPRMILKMSEPVNGILDRIELRKKWKERRKERKVGIFIVEMVKVG